MRKNKFNLELDLCLKIPENKRLYMTNHIYNENNQGEPINKEVVIISHGNNIFNFI